MRISFWPERAKQTVLGPAWPWIASESATALAARLKPTLDPYWGKRFDRVPDSLLSARAKELLRRARPSITGATPAGGGYEWVERALGGDPAAFWFFDLGCAGWIQQLARMRREGWLPAEADPAVLDVVERVWRSHGPGHAIAEIDRLLGPEPTGHPALALYRVPLALWHEKNPQAAMLALDRAVARLSPSAMTAMGVTLPLTYGFLHALSGDAARAARLLAEGRVPGRPTGWAGLASPEVRYHRARYLWDLHEFEEARQILRKVVAEDAAYVLRLATDPAWFDTSQQAGGSPLTLFGDAVVAARAALARFQQTRTQAEEEAVPEVRQLLQVMSISTDDPYLVLAAATLLPAVDQFRESQVAVGQAFYADLQRLQDFARQLPPSLPLRLGVDYRPRFRGDAESDMAQLEHLLDQGRFADAGERMEALLRDLPYAVRMASINYVQRLGTALQTAFEVLEAKASADDRARLETTYHLLQRCVACVEPIKTIPDAVGPQMTYALQKLWEEIMDIEKTWVKSEARAFGRMRLLPPDDVHTIPRGGFRAFACRVVDAVGQPVPGVPILWRVVSGPARPKEPAECLDGEWALSLQRGAAFLTVEAKGPGDGGEIQAWILGHHSPITFPYATTSGA